MEPVCPTGTYAARPSGTELIALPDGVSTMKVYYVDITGRPDRTRYEWDQCGRERATVAAGLEKVGVTGVGFVTAFPHITKVFRFAPSAEILLHVKAWDSADFSEIDLTRDAGYVEFACLAEAVIAADEYRFWAEAQSVEDYLQQWSSWAHCAIRDNAKLARHASSA